MYLNLYRRIFVESDKFDICGGASINLAVTVHPIRTLYSNKIIVANKLLEL